MTLKRVKNGMLANVYGRLVDKELCKEETRERELREFLCGCKMQGRKSASESRRG